MPLAPYQRVLAQRDVRRALLLGLLIRVPLFAAGVILTLHVVDDLGRSWSDAGLVAGAATVCIAISGPWRGKLLDRLGLRRVVLPSLLVAGACWSVAPFLGYWPLLTLASIAGLFVVPTFSIIRQAVIAAVPEGDRRTALSLDSVVVEMAFIIGPVAAIWLTAVWPTAWVLFTLQMLGVAAAVVLWWANPAIVSASTLAEDRIAARVPRNAWLRPRFVAVCAAAAAATVVLTGSDVSLVAALREWDEVPRLGVVLLLWGLGSIVGGLVYGAQGRPIPPFLLLGVLSIMTIPLAVAPGVVSMAVISFVAGLVVAPTVTATVDAVTRIVPDGARGEALGWHGSFMTAGSALGAPIGGAAIDRWGYAGGFLSVAAIGLLIAMLGAGATWWRHRGGARRTRKPAAAGTVELAA
ncbi:MFS transporter [Segeticoccus rhizosphaerae]|jgi:predicted MFS family arabinose efflux permease|uniref:MFS transporter n=1 Tax=Segeticoccus rhizosphaerae TaxID=1104777 RepID=UPI0010C05F26|nr:MULTISPECIES: MFS transporter [Intrasporangiaceae]